MPNIAREHVYAQCLPTIYTYNAQCLMLQQVVFIHLYSLFIICSTCMHVVEFATQKLICKLKSKSKLNLEDVNMNELYIRQ